jgi:prepilin-type N-terminal cleavage/methylation domain-containing protein
MDPLQAHAARGSKATFEIPARGPGAFTLIELLAVIAIIGILAALLLSAISEAKDRAIRAKCLSNVRQIDMASLSYALDNRDQMPVLVSSTALWDLAGPFATGFIGRYCSTRDALYDPGNPGQNRDDLWNPGMLMGPSNRVIGYCVTYPGAGGLKQEDTNTNSVPERPRVGNFLYPARKISDRVLIAGVVVSDFGQTNTNDMVRFTYNYVNILISQGSAGGVDGNGDLHPFLASFYARSSHLKGKLPRGDNLGMLDGSARWRKFQPMIPRTFNGLTFWW